MNIPLVPGEAQMWRRYRGPVTLGRSVGRTWKDQANSNHMPGLSPCNSDTPQILKEIYMGGMSFKLKGQRSKHVLNIQSPSQLCSVSDGGVQH
jgi:hypothetical protein